MTRLGVAATDIAAYLAARGTLTAGDALEQIMQEKVMADFLSPENYVDWRRTGFPAMAIVPNAQATAIPGGCFIRSRSSIPILSRSSRRP